MNSIKVNNEFKLIISFSFFCIGIAISADRILYFADGTAIRSVDTDGIIRTIVGRPANPVFGLQPAPCNMAVKPDQVLTTHY